MNLADDIDVQTLVGQFDLTDAEGRADFRQALYKLFANRQVTALRQDARNLGQEPRDNTRWGAIQAIARAFTER